MVWHCVATAKVWPIFYFPLIILWCLVCPRITQCGHGERPIFLVVPFIGRWLMALLIFHIRLTWIFPLQRTQLSNMVCGWKFDRSLHCNGFAWFDRSSMVHGPWASAANIYRSYTRCRCKLAEFRLLTKIDLTLFFFVLRHISGHRIPSKWQLPGDWFIWSECAAVGYDQWEIVASVHRVPFACA